MPHLFVSPVKDLIENAYPQTCMENRHFACFERCDQNKARTRDLPGSPLLARKTWLRVGYSTQHSQTEYMHSEKFAIARKS